jgi:chorismate dehydratase
VTRPGRLRVGAVGYLNARPLVYGLDHSPRFTLRYDVPSECARLLHGGAIDIGLIPSIEYLRNGPYRIVPDVAIASDGPVASVTLYTKKPIGEIRSIAMDTSSRTSVALLRVLCARLFDIGPAIESRPPDLAGMLAQCDAALMIGDVALFGEARGVQTTDLGEAWTRMTGLPFVYAFWAGPAGALNREDVRALQHARDVGSTRPEELARQYLAGQPERQALGARYLRDNIKYHLADRERAGLEAFYRYAVEAGVVPESRELCFFE